MLDIQYNLERIQERLARAAHRAGRNAATIKLVAVSKKIPWKTIRDAAACGQFIFGENYIQEAADKIDRLAANCPDKKLAWHFIGHLQSNKAKIAAEKFQVIETLDRLKLAKALDRHLADSGGSLEVLVQVNIAKEPQKSGVPPEECEKLLEQVSECPNLKITGLMTMPPFARDPEDSRPHFRKLRILAEDLQDRGCLGGSARAELSMGMSGDFEVAVEEGATLIRVGTAIFGPRI